MMKIPGLLCMAIVCGAPATIQAQDSAPSSHMVFDDHFPGDIIINEVRVPPEGHAMYTYYEALGWRGKGAGYAGIQVHPKAHNFIFSIWDHKEHREPIRALYRGPGTKTEPFGGEGTGLKSWNFELNWTTNVWYTLVARNWPHGNHTHFGFWARAGDSQRWTHLVTMQVAVADASFEGGTDAFIEDWLNTGERPRTTHLRGGWKRARDGSWHPFGQARYSVNSWDLEPGKRSYHFRNHWDGGVAKDKNGEYYFMTAGGKETHPHVANPSQHSIARTDTAPAFAPAKITACAAVRGTQGIEVQWQCDPVSTPQYAYTLELFDNPGADGQPLVAATQTVAHARSHRFETTIAPTADKPLYARLRLTDILDQSSAPQIVPVSSAKPAR